MPASGAQDCFRPQCGGKDVPRSTWRRHNEVKRRRLAGLSEGAPSQPGLDLSTFMETSGSHLDDGSRSTQNDDGGAASAAGVDLPWSAASWPAPLPPSTSETSMTESNTSSGAWLPDVAYQDVQGLENNCEEGTMTGPEHN